MKYLILFLIAGISIAMTSCKEDVKTVVVSGDSWSFFVCVDKSIEASFAKAGLSKARVNSTCTITTRVGKRAENWLGSDFDKATQVALVDARVKVLYLSLGGNDLMNDWNKNMSASERKAVLDTIALRVRAVIEKYQRQRPDIKILLSGYDFPRFIPNHPIKEYKEAFEAMGSPTPAELNSVLLEFSSTMAGLADQRNVFYIQHYGLMHYYYGNREEGLAAFQTLPPEQISSVAHPEQTGGDPNFQSDPSAMLSIAGENGIVDAFHLSKSGYEKLADHAVFHYLKSWLGEDRR